jgi:hypothetical protein
MKSISLLFLMILCVGCGSMPPKTVMSQPGVVPSIMELSPDNAHAGGPGITLTINGSSFASGATVNFNGVQQTTTFLTPNQLIATIPASAMTTAGTMPVTVTNPGSPGMGTMSGMGTMPSMGGGGTAAETSSPMNFTIN